MNTKRSSRDMNVPNCPVCKAETVKASLHPTTAYWRCRVCRTAHLHPMPSTDFLQDYYEKFHLTSNLGGIFGDFESRALADFPFKAKIVSEYLNSNRGMIEESQRVLDVGCGKGFFVKELTRLGLAAEGIDVSQSAVASGTQEMGLRGLRSGAIDEQVDWAERFDAVTAWATIEHAPDPWKFVESVRRVLKPGGLLFLDTGLGGDCVDRLAPGLIQWYDAPQHLYVFSQQGLKIILRDTGFAIVQCDPHFERTTIRRILRFARNRLVAVLGSTLFRVALGRHVFERMRMESKMPFGSLLFVVAQLN